MSEQNNEKKYEINKRDKCIGKRIGRRKRRFDRVSE